MEKYLIPIIILVCAGFISIIIIIIANKKKNKKAPLHVYQDNIVVNNSNSVLPVVPTTESVQTPSIPTVKGAPPTIDIPVPTIDDSPITIDEPVALTNENTSEAIVIEEPQPINEENVTEDEIVKVEITNEIKDDVGEKVEIEEPQQLNNEVGDSFEVPESKPEKTLGETAFKSVPTDDTNINTDIKVENPHEYIGNKTELISLREINDELKKLEENKRETL